MANGRLANLRDDIERIMLSGPIGTWTNPPSTFPFTSETVEFHSDRTGRVCMVCASESEPLIDTFAWRMIERGRMCIADSQELLAAHRSPDATIAFELIVQGTEFGEELVMVSAGKKIFDHLLLRRLWCA